MSDDSAADSHTVCFRGADWQIEAGKSAKSQTQSLQYEAQEWGLSAEEYARFEALMKGWRGIQSLGLDPLTTLGIEARSDEERCRLAEKWVQQEFAWAEKELGFRGEGEAASKGLSFIPLSRAPEQGRNPFCGFPLEKKNFFHRSSFPV
ncbi:hypothetical protein, partial [Providencia stuartii]|uniref:hypothetical protein n=1 Tax=Providencia stuartii TaxID=588 RepID=UPI0020C14856